MSIYCKRLSKEGRPPILTGSPLEIDSHQNYYLAITLLSYLVRLIINQKLKKTYWLGILLVLFQGVGGVLLNTSTTIWLTAPKQADYFVLIALLNVGLLFDFGITFSATQWIAHSDSESKANQGGENQRLRNINLAQVGISKHLSKLITGVSILMLVSLISINFFLPSVSKQWRIETANNMLLIWATVTSSLLLAGLTSLIEGLGFNNGIQIAKLFNTVIRISLTAWGISFLNNQWSIVWSTLISNIGATLFIIIAWKEILLEIISSWHKSKFQSTKEMRRMQYRMGISSACGFAIVYAPNLLLKGILDPSEMAKTSLALNINQGINQLSQAPVNYSIVRFANLIAKNQLGALRQETLKLLYITETLTIGSTLVITLLALLIFQFDTELKSRISPPTIYLLFGLANIANQIVAIAAAIMRANKHEPMMELSVFGACLTIIGTICLAPKFGTLGLALTSICGASIGLFCTMQIFKKCSPFTS